MKTIQEFSKEKGIDVASPKDSFRVAADLGVITDPIVWFGFLKDRNSAAHVYDEESVKEIFSRFPDFVDAVEALISAIESNP